jgi:uncharacterized protein with PIN domain
MDWWIHDPLDRNGRILRMTEVTLPNELEDSTTDIVVNFLRDEHELTKLAKLLDKASKKAVEYLQTVLEDVNVDGARRQQAAEKLLTFMLAANKQINDDNMARLIAQARLGSGKKKPLQLKEGDKPAGPRLDFDNVRQV